MTAIAPTYITPSGRRWTASRCPSHGERCVLMLPLGPDTIGHGFFGGVKARHVPLRRLTKPGGDRTWKPET